jgi:hypothetical protein
MDYPAFVAPTTAKYCRRSGKRGHTQIRPVVPATDLCRECHAEFARNLTHLVTYWADLRESVMRAPARVYDQTPISGGGGDDTRRDVSSYWNPAATLVLRDVTDWAGYLARIVGQQQPTDGFQFPTVRADVLAGWADPTIAETPYALAALERTSARWLSSYPTVGPSLLEDSRRYLWATQRALQTVPVRRIDARDRYCGHVITETDHGDVICYGTLVGVIRDPQGDRPSEILCSNHPDHAIPASEWIYLLEGA